MMAKVASKNSGWLRIHGSERGRDAAGLTNSNGGIIRNYVCPVRTSSYRFIRQGSVEQNLALGHLVADVRARDPQPPPTTFKKRP